MSPYCHNPPLGTRPNVKICIRTLLCRSTVRFGNKNRLQKSRKCNPRDAGALRIGFSLILGLVGLPLLERALEEVLGADAIHARLQDVSGFTDVTLNSLVEQLHGELMRRKASPLFVQSIGQAIAIHLARNYAVTIKKSPSGSPSLPAYKLRHITDWMAEHVAEDLNLARLAAQAGLSKFHFHRLFKSAAGVSPSRYHINLRMDAARRLLREMKKSVVAVALDVGYDSPSHFAQLFRRETGLSPTDYRRQR